MALCKAPGGRLDIVLAATHAGAWQGRVVLLRMKKDEESIDIIRHY